MRLGDPAEQRTISSVGLTIEVVEAEKYILSENIRAHLYKTNDVVI